MAIQRFDLELNLSSTGDAQAQKIADALNKVAESAEKAANKGKELGGLSFDGFAAKVKQGISDPLGAAGGAVESMLKALGPGGAAFAGAASAVAGIGIAAYESAKSLGALGAEIQAVSLRTGLTVKEVSQFSFAAKVAGSDIGIFETAMRRLSQGLADGSEEGKKARGALQDLGIQTRETNGNLRPMSAIFEQIGGALKAMEDPTKRNAEALRLFGRAGIELIPTLIGLADGVKRAKDLGLGPSAAEIEKFKAYQKQIVEIEAAWDSFARKAKAGIVGTVSFVVQAASSGGVPSPRMTLGKDGRLHVIPETGPRTAWHDFEASGSPAPRGSGREMSSMDAFLAGVGNPFPNSKDALISNILEGGRRASETGAIFTSEEARQNQTVEGAQAKLEKLKEAATKARNEFESLKGSDVDKSVVNEKKRAMIDTETSLSRQSELVKVLLKDEARRLAILEKTRELTAQSEGYYVIGTGALQTVVSDQQVSEQNREAREAPSLLRSAATPDVYDYQLDAKGRPIIGSKGRRVFEGRAADRPAFGPGSATGFGPQIGLSGLEYSREIVAPEGGFTGLDQTPGEAPLSPEQMAQRGLGSLASQRVTEALTVNQLNAATQLAAKMTELRAGAGDEIQTANNVAAIRLAALNQEIALTGDLTKLREESLAIELDRRMKIAEAERRDKEEFENTASGFILAAQHGQAGSFARSQLQGLEGTVLKNAAGLIYPTVDKLTPHFGGALGSLLSGTPFGPKPEDKLASAGDNLTTAAGALIEAAKVLASGGAYTPGSGGAVLPGAAPLPPGIFGNVFGGVTSNPAIFSAFGGSSSSLGAAARSFPALANSLGRLFGGSSGGGSAYPGGMIGPSDNPPSATSGNIGEYSASYGTSAKAIAGGVAQGIAGAFTAYSGFHAGGAQGALQGTAGVLGAAGGILPLLSNALSFLGPVGTIAGPVLGIASALMGDPKANRGREIQRHLKFNQFFAPEAINASMTTGGDYSDFDRFGGVRGSDLSPFPSVQEPYLDAKHNTMVPGRTLNDFGGGAAPSVSVQVQTLDSKSFTDNSHLIAGAIDHAIQTGRAPGLQNTLRNL